MSYFGLNYPLSENNGFRPTHVTVLFSGSASTTSCFLQIWGRYMIFFPLTLTPLLLFDAKLGPGDSCCQSMYLSLLIRRSHGSTCLGRDTYFDLLTFSDAKDLEFV